MIIKKEIDGIQEAKGLIESGRIVYVDENDRRIGKTSSIVSYSNWKDIPIITSSRIYNILRKDYGANNVIIIDNPEQIDRLGGVVGRGSKIEALIDETLGEEVFNALIRAGVRMAGFYHES